MAEAQDAIDSEEFGFWMAKYEREPWGDRVVENAIARLAQFVASTKSVVTELDDWRQADRRPRQVNQEQINHDVITAFSAIQQFQGL